MYMNSSHGQVQNASQPLISTVAGTGDDATWTQRESYSYVEGENGTTVVPFDTALNDDDDDDEDIPFPSMFVLPSRWVTAGLVLLGVLAALAFTVLRGWLEDNAHVTSSQLLRYGSIPLVSVVFTYVHIWLALWMTFYPVKYFGCCQIPGTNTGFGWQGIIPFKAEKMARMAVQLMTSRLFDVRAVFARLVPSQVAAEMGPTLHATLEEVIVDVAQLHAPAIWSLVPDRAKSEIVRQAHEDAPPMIESLMKHMQEHIEEVFDIEDMVVRSLVKDKALLNNIFIRCGNKEIEFIRNSGATMGLLFGIVQMIVWIWYENKWFLPGFGFVVGVATNWIALKMIFSPIQPHYPCGPSGCRIQGLFLQRQDEVAAVYGRTISKKVLNARNILTALIAGPATDKLFTLVYSHVKSACDDFAGASKPLIQLGVGADRYALIKEDICSRLLDRLPPLLQSLERYTDRALDMENMLREKMAELPPDEFEGKQQQHQQQHNMQRMINVAARGAMLPCD